MNLKHKSRFAIAGVGVACALGAVGCYERVVESRGFGSSRHDVEPVYRSETALDHAFDKLVGDQPPPEQSWRAMSDPEVKTQGAGERRPPE